jgi:hypothetical protein
VVFLFEFKEFPHRKQISVSTALLLYIFGELFGCGWYGVYLLFSVLVHIFHQSKSSISCHQIVQINLRHMSGYFS